MLLSELIPENEKIRTFNLKNDIIVAGVSPDSRQIKENDVFFCLKGVNTDGRLYIKDAIARGACAVVAESASDIENIDVPGIAVADSRRAFAVTCQRFYGNPADSMKLIAVTGTNGKSSTVMMLRAILAEAGYKVGLIGTIKYIIGDKEYISEYTTPPPDKLAQLLSEMKKDGNDYVVMEASSHALAQQRLEGLDFELGIFTNLSRDHLDYHVTMENCMKAKALLFKKCRKSLINFDDDAAYEMAWNAKDEIYYYSASTYDADFWIGNASCGLSHIEYDLLGEKVKFHVSSNLTGFFNIYNTLAAASGALLLGVPQEIIKNALAKFTSVPGRMEILDTKTDFTVAVDYAHTPDALGKALATFKGLTNKRLICVFGCGGNRDREKREIMGKIASEIADFSIVTTDNPRNEIPSDIIAQIVKGFKPGSAYTVIEDRKEAIEYALKIARAGDIVLLAGKGHENYIEDITGKHSFSDKETVQTIIGKGP